MKRLAVAVLSISLTAVSLAAGCSSPTKVKLPPPPPPFPGPRNDSPLADGTYPACAGSEALSAKFADLTQTVPGAVIVAQLDGAHNGCRFASASGLSDRAAKTPMMIDDHFRVGSITKTFTAAVIFQLVEEQTLGLDDTVERWLPGLVPSGSSITLRNLLGHTSGIYNYVEGPPRVEWSKPWTPLELVAVATAKPPSFAPGTAWEYSNTNYVLLGLIIEAATHDQWHHQVRTRLLDPLGLSHTFIEDKETVPGGVVTGYDPANPRTLTNQGDIAHPSFFWAVGDIVSTGDDLDRWVRALLRGDRVLTAEMRAQMLTPGTLSTAPYPGDALGVFTDEDGFGRYWGHSGDVPGFQSILFYYPDEGISIAILTNLESGQAPVFALETDMLGALVQSR